MIKLDETWKEQSYNLTESEGYIQGACDFQDKAIEKLTNYVTSELSLSKEDNLVDKGLFKAIEIIKNLKAVD